MRYVFDVCLFAGYNTSPRYLLKVLVPGCNFPLVLIVLSTMKELLVIAKIPELLLHHRGIVAASHCSGSQSSFLEGSTELFIPQKPV